MTQDEIIRMAREAGFVFPETQEDSFTCWWEELERFAALVAEPWIETNKALAKEIIELNKQAEHVLDTCPGCGGVADNGHDREFPPNPYYCTKCTEQAEQEPVAWIDDLEAMPFNTYCSAIVNWDSYSRDGDSFRKGTGVEIIVVKYKRNDGESAIEFLHTGDDQMLLTSCDVIKWKPLYTPPPTAPNLNCKSVQRRLATSWGYVRKEEYDMARIAAARQMRDAAVKVCEEFAEADLNARSQLEVPSASDIAKAIAALPIPGEEK